MIYKNQFVCAVKCNGSILREIDGAVILPFGCEYTLLLKNLESRKASVKINIDGQDVIYNSSLIIGPNKEVELRGFLKEGLVAKNGFKFIQKTKEIIEHRGDKLDDGLIRVEFVFEKKVVTEKKIILEEHDYYNHHHHHYDYYPWPHYYPWYRTVYYPLSGPVYTYGSYESSESKGFASSGSGISGSGEFNVAYSANNSNSPVENSIQCCNVNVNYVSSPLPDEGITVQGSIVNQLFNYGSIGELEETPNVIIIRLRGTSSVGIPVEKPIEVKSRVTCPTCGRRSKSGAKFCSKCGTGLI